MTEKIIRLAGIVRESIVDGPGIRFAVFCQGCPHKCRGCHNTFTHDFNGGYICSISKLIDEIDSDPLLTGVTFTGGEPFCQPEAFAALAEEIRKRDKLDIITFTGYTYEELQSMKTEKPEVGRLLDLTDYLIDGRFILEQRDLTLHFRGSRNQRVIDMPATRATGGTEPVLADKYM